jgi:hypothetical protein
MQPTISAFECTAPRTLEAHASYPKLHVAPRWGECKLSEVKTVKVEQWLDSLPLAPGTRTKIRNIMSALCQSRYPARMVPLEPDEQGAMFGDSTEGTGSAHAD